MKPILITFLFLFCFSSCNSPAGEDSHETTDTTGMAMQNADNESPGLEGAWEMQFYLIYQDDEITDTVTMTEGYRQVKMYYDGHVMWSRKQPRDSTQMFGYGTYLLDGDTFSENMEYGSHYMMNILDSMRIFNWVLEIGEDRYVQTEVNENGQRVYSETYRRID